MNQILLHITEWDTKKGFTNAPTAGKSAAAPVPGLPAAPAIPFLRKTAAGIDNLNSSRGPIISTTAGDR
jgi:hypothetical protein